MNIAELFKTYWKRVENMLMDGRNVEVIVLG